MCRSVAFKKTAKLRAHDTGPKKASKPITSMKYVFIKSLSFASRLTSDICFVIQVHLVSEHIWCEDYLVRSFYLKNTKTSETRTVTQFHFLSWPAAGVPVAAKALLEFRRKVNKSYRGRSCPVVVHSSNGAGRTGAYILLDLVLARMNKGAREIDIAATLEHLRDQRAGLVATRQQFEFVLMAVAEEVRCWFRKDQIFRLL